MTKLRTLGIALATASVLAFAGNASAGTFAVVVGGSWSAAEATNVHGYQHSEAEGADGGLIILGTKHHGSATGSFDTSHSASASTNSSSHHNETTKDGGGGGCGCNGTSASASGESHGTASIN